MKALRTPDNRFENLPDYPYEPRYIEIPDGDGGKLRVNYVDEGPRDADPVLLLHGEPTWSYLYRKMIPIIVDAGLRAVAPDIVGFGRSDKPADRNDYTYNRHVEWMHAVLDAIDLKNVTLVGQDWGGVIGLRLVAEKPDIFSRVVVANTGLPTGEVVSEAFLQWQKASIEIPEFTVGAIIKMGCRKPPSDEVAAAYDAPFPDESYKEGARIFPSLVPTKPDDPGVEESLKAWDVLSKFEKPFLTAFSDGDPITKGGEAIFRERVPGTSGQPHTTIKGGGHFLQEDCGEEFAGVIVDFIAKT